MDATPSDTVATGVKGLNTDAEQLATERVKDDKCKDAQLTAAKTASGLEEVKNGRRQRTSTGGSVKQPPKRDNSDRQLTVEAAPVFDVSVFKDERRTAQPADIRSIKSASDSTKLKKKKRPAVINVSATPAEIFAANLTSAVLDADDSEDRESFVYRDSHPRSPLPPSVEVKQEIETDDDVELTDKSVHQLSVSQNTQQRQQGRSQKKSKLSPRNTIHQNPKLPTNRVDRDAESGMAGSNSPRKFAFLETDPYRTSQQSIYRSAGRGALPDLPRSTRSAASSPGAYAYHGSIKNGYNANSVNSHPRRQPGSHPSLFHLYPQSYNAPNSQQSTEYSTTQHYFPQQEQYINSRSDFPHHEENQHPMKFAPTIHASERMSESDRERMHLYAKGLDGGGGVRMSGYPAWYGASSGEGWGIDRVEVRSQRKSHIFLIVVLCFMLSVCIGLILAPFFPHTIPPLGSLSIAEVSNVLATQKELLFDVQVRARNRGWWGVVVHDTELGIFVVPAINKDDLGEEAAESQISAVAKYREIRQQRRQGTVTSHTQSTPAVEFLGTVYHFDEPLTFPSAPFSKGGRLTAATSQVRLKEPGYTEDGDKEGNEKWQVILSMYYHRELTSGKFRARIMRHPYNLTIRGFFKYRAFSFAFRSNPVRVCHVARIDPEKGTIVQLPPGSVGADKCMWEASSNQLA
ncbi:hypothetical protein BZG36_02313 [Bifiguratus adelaidae]|uniref:Uncharacterized protein n=1 Tax=Bifiguratus adelaidae TaxID=1938954 RepID=A0A261Y436_9FUNG|nr:hypothetical protein BZG36_02313 [Bifiguratus adelaidae]